MKFACWYEGDEEDDVALIEGRSSFDVAWAAEDAAKAYVERSIREGDDLVEGVVVVLAQVHPDGPVYRVPVDYRVEPVLYPGQARPVHTCPLPPEGV